jgi:hypothetical protein
MPCDVGEPSRFAPLRRAKRGRFAYFALVLALMGSASDEIFGLEAELQPVVREKYIGRQFALGRRMAEIVTEMGKEHPMRA